MWKYQKAQSARDKTQQGIPDNSKKWVASLTFVKWLSEATQPQFDQHFSEYLKDKFKYNLKKKLEE